MTAVGNTQVKTWMVSLFLLGLGGILIYLFFQQFSWDELLRTLAGGHWNSAIWALPISFGVYLLRCWRWKMLLNVSGHRISIFSLLGNLSVSYLLSFFIPRAGEVLRVIILRSKEKVPMEKSAGIIVAERFTDVAILFILILSFPFIVHEQLANFFRQQVLMPLQGKISVSFWFLILGLLGLAFSIYLFNKLIKKWNLQRWDQLKQGLLSLGSTQIRISFIISTLGIWVGYYLLTWVWFFVFDETAGLSHQNVYLVFVLGTIGRSVPVQGGGAGAYHWLVAQGLGFAGISSSISAGLALVIHGGQTVFTFLMGIPSLLIFLPWMKRNGHSM